MDYNINRGKMTIQFAIAINSVKANSNVNKTQLWEICRPKKKCGLFTGLFYSLLKHWKGVFGLWICSFRAAQLCVCLPRNDRMTFTHRLLCSGWSECCRNGDTLVGTEVQRFASNTPLEAGSEWLNMFRVKHQTCLIQKSACVAKCFGTLTQL